MAKLRLGAPLTRDLPDEFEWNSFETLDMRRMLWSICTGLGLAAGLALAWKLISPDSLPLGTTSFAEYALASLVLIIGHEALHMLGFPRLGLDAHGVVGFWFQTGSPFVQYLSPMPRNRFLFAVLLPFLVVSVLPLFLAKSHLGPMPILSWISVLNGIGVGSDILIFFKMCSSVPSNALVMESGDRLFWRHPSPP